MADALFAELNRGTDITKGLRHVEKKKKDPSAAPTDDAPSAAAPVASAAAAASAPAAAAVDKGTTKKEGTKWFVDGHKGSLRDVKEVRLSEEELKQNHSVIINNCEHCTIMVPAKVNMVSLNSCKRVTIMVADIIASVSLVGCSRVNLFCTGQVKAVSIDKSESVNINLTDKGIDAEVLTSMTSAVNITIPKGEDDDVELPVADQFVTRIEKGKLVTAPVEHKG
eukprot:TRINITY_DN46152_c0_g1_i1.p1 TRINITY_DN46152_c0_g1~~TRINITY_DN46152_c0_g1_i1.p1  ORF type:complete len:224 (+),score=75.78 TRINITY_DN46152_c0_g1_i1:124-795(+)